jgi:hypothetical protein
MKKQAASRARTLQYRKHLKEHGRMKSGKIPYNILNDKSK